MLFLLIFLYVLELFMYSLNVHVHGLFAVVGKWMLNRQSDICYGSYVYAVFLLVVLKIEERIVRHVQDGELTCRQCRKCLMGHFTCDLPHILTGTTNAITCYMIADILFGILGKYFISTSDATIIHNAKSLSSINSSSPLF